MKKNILIIITLLTCQTYATAQEGEVKTEYLTSIDITEKEQNEFTGEYILESNKAFTIEVTLDKGTMSIIIPDMEESEGEMIATNQYTILAQYKDKFYLKRDAFAKIHFTRSRKTGKVISVIFNPARYKEFETFRATKSN